MFTRVSARYHEARVDHSSAETTRRQGGMQVRKRTLRSQSGYGRKPAAPFDLVLLLTGILRSAYARIRLGHLPALWVPVPQTDEQGGCCSNRPVEPLPS